MTFVPSGSRFKRSKVPGKKDKRQKKKVNSKGQWNRKSIDDSRLISLKSKV